MSRSYSASSFSTTGAFSTSASGSSSAIVAAFVSLSAVRTLMQTPLYTATVRLQIDRNVAKIVEGGDVTPIENQDFGVHANAVSGARKPQHGGTSCLGSEAWARPDFFKPRGFSLIGAVKGLLLPVAHFRQWIG